MTATTLEPVLRHLRQLAEADPVPDGPLLERFTTRGDQAAFEVLVRRHGPAVLGVCRRVLHDRDEAEDVFQATFLLLLRQARRLEARGSLGGWLYTVAFRLALRAKASARRRAALAARPRPSLSADPLEELSARELCSALDDELQRLPEHYRLVLLTCCVEGKSREEAAGRLGWSAGQVKARLERGRQLLRGRLARRGVALSVALLAANVAQQAALARVPCLIGRTARAACAVAAGSAAGGDVSASAVALVDGMLRGLVAAKLKAVAALVVALVLLAAGVAMLAPGAAPAEPEPPAKPQTAPVAPARVDLQGDPLPPDALLRVGTTRFRHSNFITQVVYAPDGKTLISTSYHEVCAWDAATGRVRHRLAGFNFGSCPFALSPDQKTVAATTLQGGVQLWDLATGKPFRAWEMPGVKDLPESQRWLRCITYAPDGRALLTCGQDGIARLWDPATGAELRRLTEAKSADRPIVFSPDGRTLAYVHTDRTIRLRETATGKEIARCAGHGGEIHGLEFSPDGKRLASAALARGNPEPTVRLWDAATGGEMRRLTGHEGGIMALTFDAEGKRLATSSRDGTIRLWDSTSGKELRRIAGHTQGATALAFAPDGKTLASGGTDQTVRQWDLATGAEMRKQPGHQDAIHNLALSPDGRSLATAGGDGTVRLWDTRTGKERCCLDGNVEAMATLVFAPDSRSLLSSTHKDRTIRFWDPVTGKELRRIQEPDKWVAFMLALSPDGKTLAAGELYFDKDILVPRTRATIWDAATGKELRQLEVDGAVMHLAFAPDGHTLFGLSAHLLTGKMRVHAWDAATGKEHHAFDVTSSPMGGMVFAFSPDGRRLALLDVETVGGRPQFLIRLLDLETGNEVGRLKGARPFRSLTFSRDGRSLAAQTDDVGAIHSWELATGKERRTFAGQGGCGYAMTYSMDGAVLASAGNDTTAVLWDVAGRLGSARGPLSATDLDARWAELAGADAVRAERAIWAFVVAADQALPYLHARLRPTVAADPAKVARLVTDLDSEQFEVRQQALGALEKLGDTAVPGLRKASAAKPSAEVQRQIDLLLEKAGQERLAPQGESLRAVRALEVLEHLGTPEARRLLEGLGQGLPEAARTREAKAALERLVWRPAP